jgi:uncharacterized membrane protein (UPF0136 family)
MADNEDSIVKQYSIIVGTLVMIGGSIGWVYINTDFELVEKGVIVLFIVGVFFAVAVELRLRNLEKKLNSR